jgi:hypothetical protein
MEQQLPRRGMQLQIDMFDLVFVNLSFPAPTPFRSDC